MSDDILKDMDRWIELFGENNTNVSMELMRGARTEIVRLTAALATARADAERRYAALRRFQYAKAWASAEAWDFSKDSRARFEWADAMAQQELGLGPLTDDEIAEIGKPFFSAIITPPAEPEPGVHWCKCPAPKPALVAYESISGRPILCSKCKGVPGDLFALERQLPWMETVRDRLRSADAAVLDEIARHGNNHCLDKAHWALREALALPSLPKKHSEP